MIFSSPPPLSLYLSAIRSEANLIYMHITYTQRCTAIATATATLTAITMENALFAYIACKSSCTSARWPFPNYVLKFFGPQKSVQRMLISMK